MSYFNEDGLLASNTSVGMVAVRANSGLSIDVNGNLTNTDRGSTVNTISNIAVLGDGFFVANSTTSGVTFAPGGRMVLNIVGNVISITDNAKGPKKHRSKHKNGSYDPDIDCAIPEDTITFAEGNGITLNSNATSNTITISSEFVNTAVLSGLITINPASVNKNAVATQTFTITGLTTSHHIVITPATALTYGIFISAAWASAANTLSIQFMNISGAAIDLGNIDINYFAWV